MTAENEGLTSQIADARADIKLLEEEKFSSRKIKKQQKNVQGKQKWN
ncbi:MAG: hypothetical protein ACLTUL_19745 [Blautia faecis]